MTRLMIDADGVISNFEVAMIPCLEEQGWETVPGEVDYYFGVPKAKFRECIRYAIKFQDLFARVKPWGGAIDGLWQLHDAGHQLVVVTMRTYGPDTVAWARFQTDRWFAANDCPPLKIVIIEHGAKKSEVCKELELTVALEDSVEIYGELTGAGVDCYLMDRPWNENADVANRVHSWAEFCEWVA